VPPIIVVLDDDDDLREALVEIIKLLGARCLGAASLRAMTELPGVLAAALAILDVNLGAGEPSGLDAYDWLRARQFKGRIVFLTGHAQSHPLVAQTVALGVRVLQKPIATSALRELLAECGP
jgi:FixJ family two-component response regulator